MRYLLGTLSDEERDRFEEMYFSDDAAFEEVEIAEGELIDRYVRGELSRTDRAQFESVVSCSPRLEERVQFARVWKDKLAVPSAKRPIDVAPQPYEPRGASVSWWASVFGPRAPQLAFASVLVLVLGSIALFAGWLRVRNESIRLDAQRAALEQRQRELDQQAANLKSQAEQIAKNTPPQPSPTNTPSPQNQEQLPKKFLAVTLIGGSVRGGPGEKGSDIRITPPFSGVNFSLRVVDADYDVYEARVMTPEGATVHKSSLLKLQRSISGTRFMFSVPAEKLPPGDYTIRLNGRTANGSFQSIEDYGFRVLR